ncbi:hypothetical protein PHYBLDRAFT_140207 [Phycomyces blakesleeanus NRRL 1555(-)]|uniref:Uncharacterized protein n=1 Tax=Phycomyces blakesleeanus (strain ATCC 8743b / DSM 1359 / FGSC 10004 / NBRC 33097 / NRRL 1555) TaxID=763407 RepID=A0A162V5T3_PHYB8|nr:hypothetical protein PHYBLDRAFT_140207 [Phycomyces blakesleeanus NRRL 1555(-)]OAD80203.1 hypothetical protein PHYBLDRAFT_140207 [Phycomyces blakesleeanus NRRL 1555(-)]|eukprot:XP_018298243.1 hypothetical protein PHYBLDRAFT_140207 [Phycomyces blakesleeanus NRRL 1555(-)]
MFNFKEQNHIGGFEYKGIRSKISQETWGTTLVPRDTSLCRLTVDVNAHESGTTRHGSPPDQTTKEIHHLPIGIVGHYFDESVKSEDS